MRNTRKQLHHWKQELYLAWRQRRQAQFMGNKLPSDDIYVKICIQRLKELNSIVHIESFE